MTDLEVVRDLCARANLRYSITIATDVSVITVQGTRRQNPLRCTAVELRFTPEGTLTEITAAE